MGITDRGRHPARRNTAVEFERRDKAAFDMEVCINEPRHQGEARHVDNLFALVIRTDPNDDIAANRDIPRNPCPCDDAQNLAPTQDDIGGCITTPLGNTGF